MNRKKEISRLEALAVGKACYVTLYSFSRLKKREPWQPWGYSKKFLSCCVVFVIIFSHGKLLTQQTSFSSKESRILQRRSATAYFSTWRSNWKWSHFLSPCGLYLYLHGCGCTYWVNLGVQLRNTTPMTTIFAYMLTCLQVELEVSEHITQLHFTYRFFNVDQPHLWIPGPLD